MRSVNVRVYSTFLLAGLLGFQTMSQTPATMDVREAASRKYIESAGDANDSEAIYPADNACAELKELAPGRFDAKYVVKKAHGGLSAGTYYLWVGKVDDIWEGRVVDSSGRVVKTATVGIRKHPELKNENSGPQARLLGKLINPHADASKKGQKSSCCVWVGCPITCLQRCWDW